MVLEIINKWTNPGEERDLYYKIEQLSDEMASLRWDIWETFPGMSREKLDGTEWEKVLNISRISEIGLRKRYSRF